MIIDSPIVSGSYAASGSFNQFGNVVISGSLTVTGSIIGTASQATSASFAGSSSFASTSSYSTFAVTSSYSLAGSGFPYSGSAQITGSLLITNLSGSGVRYVVTDANGLMTAQTASAVIKTTQAFTATAGQTTFAVTNGYSTGYVDVFINGSKLNATEFTDTSGTNIVLATGSFVNDIVEVVKYLPASGVSNNVLRQQTVFTASAGQTVFSASYTPGLLDIFLNGAKLAPDDYTANNGTTFTLATASAANDVLDVFVYSYQVGSFSGIGGVGTTGQVAYYSTSNSITGSPNFTISGSTMTVTGSLLVSGSGTFTNIGPAVLSGSVNVSGSLAVGGVNVVLSNQTSSLNVATASFAATASSADNFLARGTITAQTLVVQTITSSVDWVTGSAKFGSINSNAHQFTGSVSISGSSTFGLNVNNGALYVSASGNAGVGTITPVNGKLEIQQSATTAGLWVQTGGTTSAFTIADFRTGTNLPALQILGNGAAVFGSSVTASGTFVTTVNGAGLDTTSGNTNSSYIKTSNNGGSFFFGLDNNGGASFGNAAYSGNLYMSGNYPMLFWTSGSERMRITSGGVIGIGLPANGTGTGMEFATSSATPRINWLVSNVYILEVNATSSQGYIKTNANVPLVFGTNDTERMRIDNNGNFNFGNTVVQSSNNSSYRQAFYGGLSIMWRSASDAYININHTFSSSNTNVATYTAGTGLGRINFNGGNFEWTTYDGSVTAGTAYSLTTKFGITSAGNVGIGTTSITNRLTITDTSADAVRINSSTGLIALSISGTGALKIDYPGVGGGRFEIDDSGTAFLRRYSNGTLSISSGQVVSSSDKDLKIDDGGIESALSKILQLNPRYFYWKDSSGIESKDRQLGFYAQDVKDALGEEVANENENGKWGIYDRGIIAMLTKAVQELKSENDSLKSRIEILENK